MKKSKNMKWLEKYNRKVVRRRYRRAAKDFLISHNDAKRRHEVAYWTQHYKRARISELKHVKYRRCRYAGI